MQKSELLRGMISFSTMRNFYGILCCCIASLIIGCGEYPPNTPENNPYKRYPNIHKLWSDGSIITDPYYWARLQFTDGGVLADGETPDNYPICYATGDVNHDGQDELFIRDDAAGAKVHCVMVFSREKEGYKFLGKFEAGTVILTDMIGKGAIIAAPPSDQTGGLQAYFYNHADRTLIYNIAPWQQTPIVGKGPSAKSNKYYADLIKNGKTLQWTEY